MLRRCEEFPSAAKDVDASTKNAAPLQRMQRRCEEFPSAAKDVDASTKNAAPLQRKHGM
jgi:hypothetical protein